MHHPCANQACNKPMAPSEHKASRPTGLCSGCRIRWQLNGVPTGGFIPSDALRAVAKETLNQIKPTPSELKEAVRLARGTRHREGAWAERPVYSFNMLMARPRITASRRLPQMLVGRRKPPDALSIMVAALHYHIAVNHLGVGRRYAKWLCGTSFMLRRHLIRPTGLTGSLKGRGDVTSNYRLERVDFEVIGTHVLKIAERTLGVTREIGRDATVMYLQGVHEGRFNRSVIVPYSVQRTTGAGDSPLDHYLPDHVAWSPQYGHGLRRASGKINGKWPEGLDIPLDEETPSSPTRSSFEVHRVRTYRPSSEIADWLFVETSFLD